MVDARRERVRIDERIAVPESDHWKFAYPGFRQAWADGNIERVNAWTPDDDLASEYDPTWTAPTDGIDEVEDTDAELAETLRWSASEATRRYQEETHRRAPALVRPEDASNGYCGTVAWHRRDAYDLGVAARLGDREDRKRKDRRADHRGRAGRFRRRAGWARPAGS